MSGTITGLSSGTVYVYSYAITAAVPSSQATFYVNGVKTAYSSLKTGQKVSVIVNPFTGTLKSVVDVAVSLTASSGTVTVPAQTLPATTQQQIYVKVKLSNGTTTVMTLYQALRTSGMTIVSAAPKP